MRNLDLKPGDKFAHFVIVRLIGQGGMGRVFEAEHELTGRRTALKLMLEHLVDEDMRARMIQEARALAELDHPNVVRLYDANITDGAIWLAMEFLQGRSLRTYRNTAGPVPVAQALHLLIETADGVAAAHEIGIVHRDLKPENILLTDQNVTKVLDFGAAKVVRGEKSMTTAIGAGGKRRIIGTPEYMSPEHLRGDRVGDRTDSYALAVIGMELLWDHPFRNPDGTMPEMFEMVRRQFVEPPPHLRHVAPHVPGEVADLLYRGLAKNADDRPSTAEIAAGLRTARTSFKAANPDVDSAPFAKEWTGPGAWAARGPAVSLPRHAPAPKEPSRSVVVQASAPAPSVGAVSAAPESPPILSGEAPRSLATPVYAKTQELAPAPPPAAAPEMPREAVATLDLRAPKAPAMTVVPVTVGPAQRASHPAQVRARRTRVLVFLAMCGVVGVGAVLFVLRGSFRSEPRTADLGAGSTTPHLGEPKSTGPLALPPLPDGPGTLAEPAKTAPPSQGGEPDPEVSPTGTTPSAAPSGPRPKTSGSASTPPVPKPTPAGKTLDLPFMDRPPSSK